MRNRDTALEAGFNGSQSARDSGSRRLPPHHTRILTMIDQERTRDLGFLEAYTLGLGTMIGVDIFVLRDRRQERVRQRRCPNDVRRPHRRVRCGLHRCDRYENCGPGALRYGSIPQFIVHENVGAIVVARGENRVQRTVRQALIQRFGGRAQHHNWNEYTMSTRPFTFVGPPTDEFTTVRVGESTRVQGVSPCAS